MITETTEIVLIAGHPIHRAARLEFLGGFIGVMPAVNSENMPTVAIDAQAD